jgi:hypothetical protein
MAVFICAMLLRETGSDSWQCLMMAARKLRGHLKRFIELMPQREDDYYEWGVNNPITSWAAPTYILRPEVDLIVSEEVGHDFICQHQCQVTIMPDGEMWLRPYRWNLHRCESVSR